MSYNLLLDTSFEKNERWKYTNCKYENGYLISNNNVFGIEQELILPELTKLYFRWNYKVEQGNIKDIKIGIQNKDILNINTKVPKLNKKQTISVIDIAKQPKVKLHLIFESKDKVNKVYIGSPLLIDLNAQNKSTWLKWVLDKTLYFMNGYTYTNLYKDKELKPKIDDLKDFNFETAKVGSLVKTSSPLNIPLNTDLIEGHTYLIKLEFKEVNKLGKAFIQYGILKSSYINDNQLYLILKAKEKEKLNLILEANDILPYQINLRHLLLIDITKMKLRKEDISSLSFI